MEVPDTDIGSAGKRVRPLTGRFTCPSPVCIGIAAEDLTFLFFGQILEELTLRQYFTGSVRASISSHSATWSLFTRAGSPQTVLGAASPPPRSGGHGLDRLRKFNSRRAAAQHPLQSCCFSQGVELPPNSRTGSSC